MQRDITIGGEAVWLRGITGQVRGEKKWAETQVHGSGGGGSVYNGTGYTHPVRVSSTVTTRHEFWLVGTDGEETCVALANSGVRVREGQVVSVVCGASRRLGRGPFLLLHNQASGERSRLGSDALLLSSMGLYDPYNNLVRFVLWAAVLLGVLTLGSRMSLSPLCFIVGGGFLIAYVKRMKRERNAVVLEACGRLLEEQVAATGHVYGQARRAQG